MKWPLGTKIRFAFQTPLDTKADFARARALVAEYAERWREPGVQIDWTFELAALSPALGNSVPAPFQHRSGFAPDERVPYDVLISLDPLPIVIEDPFRGPAAARSEIRFPVSELGSYCRRADYGAPTMYLGPFGRWKSQGLVDYLREDIGQHVVVHELGHAFGLPHLHQHPDLIPAPSASTVDVTARTQERDRARAAFYLPPDALVDELDRILGVRGSSEDVQNHVTRVWRGNEAYSDWAAFAKDELQQHELSGKLESVMSVPYYSALTVAGSQRDATIVTAPTDIDKRMLKRMYSP